MHDLSFSHARPLVQLVLLGMVALTSGAQAAARAESAPEQSAVTEQLQRTEGSPGVAETAPASGSYNISGRQTGRKAVQPAPPIQMGNEDRMRMRELALLHLGEIKMAALATAISQDAAVRSYAEKMLEEHVRALNELRQLADRSGTILPGGVEKEQAMMLDRLALQAGQQFDRLYMQQAAFAMHQQAHRVIQQVAGSAQSPELKAYASALVPVVGQHLQLAQQMNDDPRNAANAVRASLSAGQSVAPASSGGVDNQAGANSAAKGHSSIAGSTTGQGR